MNVQSTARACWCGNTDLADFSPEYRSCKVCGTLVTQVGLVDDELLVKNDDDDFYGKQYWLGHQQQDLGFPDIYARARADLTERNLHWLKALLKYRTPSARVMELGCSQGSFVALMRQTGFDASGVEMSPWVVDFGRKTFGIPVEVGPVENLEVAPGSIDVIALMDVMEHLPDPVGTMRHCLTLLKPDGFLLIQTPQFRPDMQYQSLLDTRSPFLEQLKSDEHLYLFTDSSAMRLFKDLGAEHVTFEPAIFSQYDMFFVVSRTPLTPNTPEQVVESLTRDANGRMALALLDLREREIALTADRLDRGKQIETLTRLIHESEADRTARGEQIAQLTAMVRESEADRAARGEQIETLTQMVHEIEADRQARGEQITTLTALLNKPQGGSPAP